MYGTWDSISTKNILTSEAWDHTWTLASLNQFSIFQIVNKRALLLKTENNNKALVEEEKNISLTCCGVLKKTTTC